MKTAAEIHFIDQIFPSFRDEFVKHNKCSLDVMFAEFIKVYRDSRRNYLSAKSELPLEDQIKIEAFEYISDQVIHNFLALQVKPQLESFYQQAIFNYIESILGEAISDAILVKLSQAEKEKLKECLLYIADQCAAYCLPYNLNNEEMKKYVLVMMKADKSIQDKLAKTKELLNGKQEGVDIAESIANINQGKVTFPTPSKILQIGESYKNKKLLPDLAFISKNADKTTSSILNPNKFEPKTEGASVGFISEKSHKPESKWMVKKQTAAENATEYMCSNIARYFVGDNAAKVKLLAGGGNNNGGKETWIASKFIANFTDCSKHYSDENYKAKEALNNRMFNDENVTKIYDIVAVNLLFGNYDIHAENLGVVNKEGKLESAVVDFGKGLNFYNRGQFAALTQNNPTAKLGEGVIKPADMLRLIHGGFYKVNSPNFLNKKFVDSVNSLVNKFSNNPNELNSIVRNIAQNIVKNMTKEQMENLFSKLGEGINYENFVDEIVSLISDRVNMMKEFALDVSVQIAIRDNDVVGLQSLLRENKDLFNKEIKWLSEDESNNIPSHSTILEYAKSRGKSSKMIEAIEAENSSITKNESQIVHSQKTPFYLKRGLPEDGHNKSNTR